MNIIPPDNRTFSWAEMEADIQDATYYKDPCFRLAGDWKGFIRTEGFIDVYLVDGSWVNDNLSVIFGHGGHGFVHEFIPRDEVWISDKHHGDCDCGVPNGTPLTDAEIEETICHELRERELMLQGKSFWEAHNLAEEHA